MVSSQDLKIRYVGDTSGVQKSLGQINKMHTSAASKLKSVGAKMTSTGKSLTAGLTLPLVAFGAVAVKEFGEAAKVGAQTEAVIKSTGGAANVTASHVGALSERLGNLAVVDDEVVQQGANMLLTFKNIRNEAGAGNKIFDRSTKALLDMATAMGKEPKAAAVQLGKALNDPIKGMTALGRAGVQFTAQQERQITKMVESGDVLGAQKLILKELETQFGGSAAAAGRAATPIDRLKVAGANLAESIGSFIVPMLEVASRFVERLASAFQNASPAVQRAVVVAGALAAALGPVLFVLGKTSIAVANLIPVVAKLWAVLMANPWVLIAAAVIALVIVIVKNWDKIKAFLLKVWNAIKAAARAVWNAIKAALMAVWRAIAAVIRTYFNIYKAIVLGVWRAILAVSRTVWNAIKTVVLGPIGFIRDKIGAALGWLREKWGAAWRSMRDLLSGIWSGITGAIRSGVNVVIGLVEGVINRLIDAYNRVADAPVIGAPLPHISNISLPRLYRGGRITSAGLAIVGERGPELVRLSRGAEVVPAGPTRDLLGAGGTTVVNIHVAGSVLSERDLMDVVRSGLLKAQRRNGPLGLA
jgi:phage-related protein